MREALTIELLDIGTVMLTRGAEDKLVVVNYLADTRAYDTLEAEPQGANRLLIRATNEGTPSEYLYNGRYMIHWKEPMKG